MAVHVRILIACALFGRHDMASTYWRRFYSAINMYIQRVQKFAIISYGFSIWRHCKWKSRFILHTEHCTADIDGNEYTAHTPAKWQMANKTNEVWKVNECEWFRQNERVSTSIHRSISSIYVMFANNCEGHKRSMAAQNCIKFLHNSRQ